MHSIFNEPSTDFQIQLSSHSLKIPLLMLDRNYNKLQKLIESCRVELKSEMINLNKLFSFNDLKSDKLALQELTLIIKRIDVLEKKLHRLVTNDIKLLQKIKTRLSFFAELEKFKMENDFDKLIGWYQIYTNILIGDYLTRNFAIHSQVDENSNVKLYNAGTVFLQQQNLSDLVDSDLLLNANKISNAITKQNDLEPLLEWIDENQTHLNSSQSSLQFEARLQQYIQLLNLGKYKEAIACFKKYLFAFAATNFDEIQKAAGLLLYLNLESQKENDSVDEITFTNDYKNSDVCKKKLEIPTEVEGDLTKNEDELNQFFFYDSPQMNCAPILPRFDDLTDYPHYNSSIYEQTSGLLDDTRWDKLNDLFFLQFYEMYGIPLNDPLLIFLSLGISALKTKNCLHEKKLNTSESSKLNEYCETKVFHNKCPVCAPEFAKVTKQMPYAHHVQSELFDNPVMLPNGNVYDKVKLVQLADLLRDKGYYFLEKNEILDPIDKAVYEINSFITMYPT